MKSKIAFILKSAFWSFIAVAAIWRLLAFVSPAVYSQKIMAYFLVCYLIIFAGWLLVGLSRRKKEEKRNEKERADREIGSQARLVRDKETYLAQLPELRQGATETEKRHFQEAFAKSYPNLALDPDYLDFLNQTNGININGYQLYGTQELMEKNETWEDKAEFVIAEVPEWTFAYDFESQGYCVYDKELDYSGIYGVFDDLLVYEILQELVESLQNKTQVYDKVESLQNETRTYDKVDWHYENALETYYAKFKQNIVDGLPYRPELVDEEYEQMRQMAGNHIGLFLTWLIDHHFESDEFEPDNPELLAVRQHEMLGIEFLIGNMDGKFWRSDVSAHIRPFVDAYYPHYFDDYSAWLQSKHRKIYDFVSDWDDYAEVASKIDSAYADFSAGKQFEKAPRNAGKQNLRRN